MEREINEARRFIRYVMPGLLFGVQFIVIMLILQTKLTVVCLVRIMSTVGFGAALGAILASGGMGYFFSIVHHTIHNCIGCDKISSVDHRKVVNFLIRNGKIRLLIYGRKGNTRKANFKINRNSAWVILTAMWRERSGQEGFIKGADLGATANMDMVHSAGTARVAALAALGAATRASHVAALFLEAGCKGFVWPTPFRWGVSLAVGLVFVGLHHCNYLHLGRKAQSLIDAVFADHICLEANPLQKSKTVHMGIPYGWDCFRQARRHSHQVYAAETKVRRHGS